MQPAQRLFLRLVTSAWQNQQILSALSLMLSLPEALAWAAVRTVASSSLLASASALFCLVFFPSCRIFLILFLFPAFGQSLGQNYTNWDSKLFENLLQPVIDIQSLLILDIQVNARMKDQLFEYLTVALSSGNTKSRDTACLFEFIDRSQSIC